jgi:hypothetical protein
VERIYQAGKKSLKTFAYRLIKAYFSKNELADKNVSLFGVGSSRQKLDPIRISYIKKHLKDRNGRPLSAKQWLECKMKMAQAKNTEQV